MNRRATAFSVGLLAAFCCATLAWTQEITPPVSPVAPPESRRLAAGSRVRLAIAAELSARELVTMVDPMLPVNRLEWRDDVVAVVSNGRVVSEVPRPGRRIAGTVVRSDSHGVLLRRDRTGTAIIVPWAAIRTIEHSVTNAPRWKHASLGALLGAAGGAGLALVAEGSCGEEEFLCPGPAAAVSGAGLGAAVGALVGVLLPPGDRWAEAEARPRPGGAETMAARFPRVTFTIGTGGALTGGPARDLEGAMRAAGYNGRLSGCFVFCSDEPIQYPKTYRALFEQGRPLLVEGGWSLSPAWAVRAQWQRTPIGLTTGLAAESYNFVDVGYRVTTASVLLSRQSWRWRLGVGPALHRVGTRADRGSGGQWSSSAWAWGYVADAGLRLPARTPVFFDAGLQYTGGGRIRVGPFRPTYGPQTEVPAIDVSPGHWYLGVGAGVRFGSRSAAQTIASRHLGRQRSASGGTELSK